MNILYETDKLRLGNEYETTYIISYPFIETIAAVVLISGALFARMLFEEKFLLSAYPDYAAYMKRTKRIIPFLF